MRLDVKRDLENSIYDTEKILFPKLKELKCFSGELINIQKASLDPTMSNYLNLIARFDQLAGIDIWNIKTNKGIIGIANRIQWTKNPYNTFTIRRTRDTGTETEYPKVLRSLENETLYPKFMIHSYISERRIGELLTFAIAKTRDVFQVIIDGNCEIKTNIKGDKNTFFYVYWDRMKEEGFEIQIYDLTEKEQKKIEILSVPYFLPDEYKRLFDKEFTREFFDHLKSLNNSDNIACFMSKKFLKKNFEDLEENEKYHLTVCNDLKRNEE